jgi:hypothetical protein
LRPDPARWFDNKIEVQCAKYLKITLVEVAFPQVCFLDRLFQPAETKNPQPVEGNRFGLLSMAVFLDLGRSGCGPFYRNRMSDPTVSQLSSRLAGLRQKQVTEKELFAGRVFFGAVLPGI